MTSSNIFRQEVGFIHIINFSLLHDKVLDPCADALLSPLRSVGRCHPDVTGGRGRRCARRALPGLLLAGRWNAAAADGLLARRLARQLPGPQQELGPSTLLLRRQPLRSVDRPRHLPEELRHALEEEPSGRPRRAEPLLLLFGV